jgi:phosphoribosylformylglycinamidine cyclo-ligase
MSELPDARYRARGASAAKNEVHAAITGLDRGLFPGAFCQVLPDLLGGSPDHALVLHADGAGTKSSLAYLAWREGADLEVWRGIAQDSLVMNLDDCACVGALGPFVVSNTIGRNAKRIPGEVVAAIIAGYRRLAEDLAAENIAVHLAGGETADVGDLVRTVIVDSTVACRLRREEVVDASRMAPGDVIVGFASFGRARWERSDNSGIGSNGLTSARHEVLGGEYADRYPETWAPEMARELAYCGPYRLGDALPGAPGMTVGQALLSPTRTYLPLIRRLLGAIGPQELHGLIHCSGGGQTKILKFGHGLRYIKDSLPPLPPLFATVARELGLAPAELHAVYNCGVRLEAVLPERHAAAALAAARDCGIAAWITGHVEAASGTANELLIRRDGAELHYGG